MAKAETKLVLDERQIPEFSTGNVPLIRHFMLMSEILKPKNGLPQDESTIIKSAIDILSQSYPNDGIVANGKHINTEKEPHTLWYVFCGESTEGSKVFGMGSVSKGYGLELVTLLNGKEFFHWDRKNGGFLNGQKIEDKFAQERRDEAINLYLEEMRFYLRA